VQLKSGLRLIMLNTNLYYYNDHEMAHHTDPARQFAWLDNVLKDAEEKSDLVSICNPLWLLDGKQFMDVSLWSYAFLTFEMSSLPLTAEH